MDVSTEREVKALVNSALCAEDVNEMLGLLVRARQLQPHGQLAGGYEYVLSRANPRGYYEQRRALILERFALGHQSGIAPKISGLAREFGCSTSTVFEIKSSING